MSQTTKVSERKIRAPVDFDGNRLQTTSFLNSCQTYLRLNKALYPTDEDKIIFVLSYMIGGTAGPVKDAITAKALEIDPTTNAERGFGSWVDFLKEFQKTFQPLNPVDDAITRMKALKQTSTADEYVAEFRPLAVRSGINQTEVLSDYFLTGLNNGLVRNILTAQTLPTTMEGYYELATRLDLQWRKGQEIVRGTTTRKEVKEAKSMVTTSANTNRNNTTRLRKLTAEERDRLFKEGRCFRCREHGHRSAECPNGSQQPQRRQIKVASSGPTTTGKATATPDPQAPISRIRALFAELTPAEKEEVVNIAEAEGF